MKKRQKHIERQRDKERERERDKAVLEKVHRTHAPYAGSNANLEQ